MSNPYRDDFDDIVQDGLAEIATQLKRVADALERIANVKPSFTLSAFCNASFMAGAACELPEGHEGPHWSDE